MVIQDVLLFMEYLFVNLLNLFDWFNGQGYSLLIILILLLSFFPDLLSKDYTILFMPLFGRKGQLCIPPANSTVCLEGPNDISMATVLKSFLSSFKPLTLEVRHLIFIMMSLLLFFLPLLFLPPSFLEACLNI